MKLIFDAKTFSQNDSWTEFDVYKHGTRYRVEESQTGLGSGILCDDEPPNRYWVTAEQAKHLYLMDQRNEGTVREFEEAECAKLLEA